MDFRSFLETDEREMMRLASLQARKANDILQRHGKEAQDYRFYYVPLDQVKPSQVDDDYDNPSSQELSKHILDFGRSGRMEDYAPVAVDKDWHIVDGNHRHAARKLAGSTIVPVIFPIRVGDGKVES